MNIKRDFAISSVYELLKTGRYSVREIARLARVADPRSEVRRLKQRGIDVRSSWWTNVTGARFKKYWIHNDEQVAKES